MECNKDESIRSKLIAERKFEQKDFLGARKFALKAQTLYPGLEGISQMLTTVNVYLSAENKISGEIDWYGVLGVNPSADDDTIKKKYRKLALMLHPDKNNSVGADGGFKLISEACRMLLDKEKRASYDERRGYKGFVQKAPTDTGAPSASTNPNEVPGSQSVPPRPNKQKVPSTPLRRQKKVPSAPTRPRQKKVPVHTDGPSVSSQPRQKKARGHATGPSAPPQPCQQEFSTHPFGPSAPTMENQFFNFASRNTSIPKSQNRNAKAPSTPNPSPPHHIPDTFWTVCFGCNIQYEYLKIFCSHTLLCRTCVKPFMALEIVIPASFSKTGKPGRKRSFKNLPGENAYDLNSKVAAEQKPVPGNIVLQAHDNLKRSHSESQVSPGLEGCFKKGKVEDDSNRNGMNRCVAQETSDFTTEGAYGLWIHGFSGTSDQPSITRELTPPEKRKLLMLNAQKEILKKLSGSGF